MPTFDTKSLSTAQAAGTTSFSWSHTVGSGANRVLIVGIGTTTGDNVSAVTFNSVSMTKILSATQGASAGSMSVWILLNPASGSHSIAVTLTSDTAYGSAASFSDVIQSNTVNQTNATGGFSASSSHSLTPSVDNCHVVEMIYWVNNAAASTASVGWTFSVANDAGTAQSIGIALKGPISPAASTTNTWDNISRSWESIMISLAPYFDTTTPWAKVSRFDETIYAD